MVNFKDVFNYENGKIFWKISPSPKVKVGDEAGTKTSNGYLVCRYKGRNYLVHRIVYSLYNEVVPAYIDHIDGNRENNLIQNLRPASPSENSRNSLGVKETTSKYKGVYFHKISKKWSASIRVDRKLIYLGLFENESDAAHAYDTAAEKYHKDFAKLNY